MRAERTVMEAVTVILVGGLHVGVLLEGKKDRDDKQTLLQAGISRNNKIESLGFTLEHSPRRTPPSLTCPDSLLSSDPVLPCASFEPAQRIPVMTPAITDHMTPEPPQISTLNNLDSDHDSVYSNSDASSSVNKTANSKDIVPVPAITVDPLSISPPRKSRRSELAQRGGMSRSELSTMQSTRLM